MIRLLNIDLLLKDGQETTKVQFRDPLYLNEISLKSLSCNSPAFTIPKKKYELKIGSKYIETDDKFFASIEDLLANIQKKGDIEFYLSKTEQETVNLVSISDGVVAPTYCTPDLGVVLGGQYHEYKNAVGLWYKINAHVGWLPDGYYTLEALRATLGGDMAIELQANGRIRVLPNKAGLLNLGTLGSTLLGFNEETTTTATLNGDIPTSTWVLAPREPISFTKFDYKLSSDNGHVVHLNKHPVIPATVNLYILNCERKNELDPKGNKKFRLATMPGSHETIRVNYDINKLFFHKLDETFQSIVFELRWADGSRFVTHNQNVNIVLAYR